MQAFCPRIDIFKGSRCILRIRGAPVRQRLGMILENKVFQILKLSRNVNCKSLANLYTSLGNLETHITIFTVIVTISGRIIWYGCRIIIKDYHAPFGVIQCCAY